MDIVTVQRLTIVLVIALHLLLLGSIAIVPVVVITSPVAIRL